MVGRSWLLGLHDRQPDKFHEFRVGADDAVDLVGDRARVHGKKARIEAARPARRRDRPHDEMQRREIGQHAGVRKGPPGTIGHRRHRVGAPPEHQPGLFEGLADGGERQRARLGGARPRDAAHEARLGMRIEIACRQHVAIARLHASAGKHELAGHELQIGVAPAEQHLRRCARAVDQDQRRGVARLEVRMALVALDLGEALGEVWSCVSCLLCACVRPARSWTGAGRPKRACAYLLPSGACAQRHSALPTKARIAARPRPAPPRPASR